ncbi:MAG: ThiF family adenylyltransferase [Nitrososphaeraceae archaeon]|nr:ThiF family adenylyltransferase [Nitrososphaeraceae archaeon]
MTDNQNQPKIDENLYSRQLYAIGHDAMQKAAVSKVLISGLSGLGVEIAKSAILQGFKSVTIHDTGHITQNDLSTNYYATKRDIGKNKAEVSFRQLSELNNYVEVDYSIVPLQNKFLSNFNIVVLVDCDLEKQLEINKFTHENKIHFISTATYGLVGQIFCDFGENFVVNDQDGEQVRTVLIESIENSVCPLIKCAKDKPHGLTSGNIVKFSKILGMLELNDKESEIEYVDRFSFRIKIDTSHFGKYINGGEAIEVKSKRILNFKSL